MDYEKAYKESFEAAKGLHDAGNALTKRQMEIVFPQLRESEDERIRKAIVHLLEVASEAYLIDATGLKKEQFLAYLEKQKEQKPAEWSDEDKDMLNSCISSIEEAKENRYAYKETDGDTSYDHEIAWLELLRNRVGKEFLQPHWKPSEEDEERLINTSISFLKDFADKGYENAVECIDWLKSLRNRVSKEFLQPHWKPSEEQMDSLHDTIVHTKEYSYSMYLPELYEQLKAIKEDEK